MMKIVSVWNTQSLSWMLDQQHCASSKTEMDDEEKKQEITSWTLWRQRIFQQIGDWRCNWTAGGGATMIGGEFSEKVLLNGKDNGKQEYINPDMMDSLASCIECSP